MPSRRQLPPALAHAPPRSAFLAVADEEFGRQIPFGFLEKVKEDFLKNYGETGKNAVSMSLNRVYGCAYSQPSGAPTLSAFWMPC